MSNVTITFRNNENAEFVNTLRKRVKDYFETNRISTHGNANMVSKTVVMLSIYFTPYILMITGVFSNHLLIYLLWFLMSIGMSGIGFAVMHDANHGSYSGKSKVNFILSYLMNLIGGSTVNWKIQHNMLHHSYTNIDGIDEDIDNGGLMRFSPNQKRIWIHRFQFIYAWFLYCLLTLNWVLWKDFQQIFHFKKLGLLEKQHKSMNQVLISLLISKSIYFSYTLIIPLLVLKVPWWEVVLGFVFMHILAGLIFGCIFQPAHVVTTSAFPIPDAEGTIEQNWAIHQLQTTADYSPKSKLFSWLIGGLNYQIEHHLFPTICHVHYRKIAKIVRETTAEFGIPYYVHGSFVKALRNHFILLKRLGQKNLITSIL